MNNQLSCVQKPSKMHQEQQSKTWACTSSDIPGKLIQWDLCYRLSMITLVLVVLTGYIMGQVQVGNMGIESRGLEMMAIYTTAGKYVPI